MHNHYLTHYQELVKKIDNQCALITESWHEQIVCTKGCDECCLHITVFPVEAVSIAFAMKDLTAEQVRQFQSQAKIASNNSSCPLLANGACMIYDVRPIICRTHGFPILSEHKGQQIVDYCPKNFTSATTLPGNAFLSIDNINIMLAAVNQQFIKDTIDCFSDGDRIAISDILKQKF